MTLNEIIKNKTLDKEYSLVLKLKEIFRTPDGLNIFTVTDDQDTFKITKFTPGKQLHERLVVGDIKEFTFKTKLFQGNLQGDLLNIVDINPELVQRFKDQLHESKQSAYAPKQDALLIDTPTFAAMKPSMLAVSGHIRKAVMDKRPIHITHHGDCDGFSAALLLEQSIIGLIKKKHPHERYLRQYISRNPSKPPYYDVMDASKDIGFFLNAIDRFNVVAPLIIIVDNGSTKQDLISIEKVKLYGADVMVIDHHDPGVLDEEGKSVICKHTLAHVNPHLQGRKGGISASMLCYQVASYISDDVTPNAFTAAVGGVTDRCEGEEIEFLIKKTTYDREYLRSAGIMVDYEIYMTKMNLQAGGIYTLLLGEAKKRDALMSLYKPILDEQTLEVKKSLKQYATQHTWGKHKVSVINGDQTTLWADYFTIGKLAGISFDLFDSDIVIVHTNSIMVFRAKEETGFDVNALIVDLKEHISYARISGGGHAVAGSIKFISAGKDEIISYVQQKLEQ